MSTPDQDAPHDAAEPRALNMGVGAVSPLWPAFAMMASVGAAYWWWSQWGRSMSAQVPGAMPIPQAPLAPAEPPPLAHPAPARLAEAPAPLTEGPAPLTEGEIVGIMAHSPPPEPLPTEAVDPSDAALVEPAGELMLHAPPESVGVRFESGGEVVDAPEPEAVSAPPLPLHDAPVQEAPAQTAQAAGLAPEALSVVDLLAGSALHAEAVDFSPDRGNVSAAALMSASEPVPEPAEPVLSPEASDELTESLGVQGASMDDGAAGKPKARRKPPTPTA